VNRCAILFSCLGWFLIVGGPKTKLRIRDVNTNKTSNETDAALHGVAKTIVFIVVLALGISENLARKANMISIERDWVPALAPETGPIRFTLTQVNATMAMIDMISKLIAPIAISGLISVVSSVRFGVAAIAATNVVSLGPEIWSARSLWDQCDALRQPKLPSLVEFDSERELQRSFSRPPRATLLQAWLDSISNWRNNYIPSLKLFFSTEVWIPSMAMSMLHSSMLSVTGIVIVFLLNSGYSLKVVTIAEAASSAFEIGSAFLAPVAVRRLCPTTPAGSHRLMDVPQRGEEEVLSDTDSDIDADDLIRKDDMRLDVNAGVIRLGLWGVFEMFLTLVSSPVLPLIPPLSIQLIVPEGPYPAPPLLSYTYARLSHPS
jgi:iron-regulated transporter 1